MTKLRVSASSISEFQRCPRRWYLKHQLRLGPTDGGDKSRSLQFGSAFHAALQQWSIGDADVPDRLIAAQQVFAANATDLSWEDRQLGPQLLVGYAAMYNSEHLRLHSLPSTESEVVLPILDADGNPDPGLEFVGVLDSIGYADDCGTVIVEHKTTSSNINTATFWDRYDRSIQLPLYWLAAVDCGRSPQQLIVDVIRAPIMHRAKATPIERREFYKRAASGAAVGDPKPGTRLTDESREEFIERVTEAILSAPTEYYARRPYTFTDHDLRMVRLDLWAIAQQMLGVIRSGGYSGRNPGGCVAYATTCEFDPACWHGADLDDRQLYTIRPPRK